MNPIGPIISNYNKRDGAVPVIDLFAGAGGLGEGFNAYSCNGEPVFDVCLSIEKDPNALETLRLRKLFHAFQPGDVPEEYYDFIQNGSLRPISALGEKFGSEWRRVKKQVLDLELGLPDMDSGKVDSALESALGRNRRDWVLVGGPPCQAYSTAGRSRNQSKADYRPEHDTRHFLYEEYLRIIARHWPAVVVMENVTGILSSSVNGQRIFANILRDLADPAQPFGERRRSHAERFRYRIFPLAVENGEPDLFGYAADRPADYIVECERFGIPQRRHRVILLALRDDITSEPAKLQPFTDCEAQTGDILAGIPRLRSGLTDNEDTGQAWTDALCSASRSAWIREVRNGEAGSAVCDRILHTLDNLRAPASGRGGEFVRTRGGKTDNGAMPEHLRDWIGDARLGGFCNLSTRSHMTSDLHRYLFCASYATEYRSSPKLVHFPPSLLPDHRSAKAATRSWGNHADRFRVQLAGEPSTTVMSHISKDGHYYIHPDPGQSRSLTVREAARLQTFPDNYYFYGNRGPQYVQVGNAVPPYLSRQIAGIIAGILEV